MTLVLCPAVTCAREGLLGQYFRHPAAIPKEAPAARGGAPPPGFTRFPPALPPARIGSSPALAKVPGWLADQYGMPETTFDDLAGANPGGDLFTTLSSLLWNEREAMEHLLYRLGTEQLLLDAGQLRWLAKADDDVAEAIERTRLSEVLRAAETEHVAIALGLNPDATLQALVEAAPEHWSLVFSEHRAALRSLVLDVQSATTDVRTLLYAGANMISQTLDAVTHSVQTYTADGSKGGRAHGALLLDAQA